MGPSHPLQPQHGNGGGPERHAPTDKGLHNQTRHASRTAGPPRGAALVVDEQVGGRDGRPGRRRGRAGGAGRAGRARAAGGAVGGALHVVVAARPRARLSRRAKACARGAGARSRSCLTPRGHAQRRLWAGLHRRAEAADRGGACCRQRSALITLNLPLPHACGRWAPRQCMRPGRARLCGFALDVDNGRGARRRQRLRLRVDKDAVRAHIVIVHIRPRAAHVATRARSQAVSKLDAGICAHARLSGPACTQRARAARPRGARPCIDCTQRARAHAPCTSLQRMQPRAGRRSQRMREGTYLLLITVLQLPLITLHAHEAAISTP